MKKLFSKLVKIILITTCVLLVQTVLLLMVGYDPVKIVKNTIASYKVDKETKLAELHENEYDQTYLEELNSLNLFSNTSRDAVPQTMVYSMVTNHFTKSTENKRKKAIIIGYDGCRTDTIANMIKSEKSGIARIKDEGIILISFAGGEGRVFQDTSSGPGWASILSGHWANKHGVYNNDGISNTETFLTKFSQQGYKTIFIAQWRPLFTNIFSKDIENSIKQSLPIDYEYVVDDTETYYSLLKCVTGTNANLEADIIFAIFDEPDQYGHSSGYGSEAYTEACKKVDGYAYEIINTILSRETYESEDWLIILTTDHGGFLNSHGKQSNLERITWIVSNKK